MNGRNPQSTAKIAGHPIHPILVTLPIASFIGALGTDIGFRMTGELGWATASNWLLGIGLVTALFAAAAGLTDYMGDDRIRRIGAATRHMIANVTVIVIEAINLLVRLTDGSDTVPPLGLWLSIAAVLVLGYSGWLGGELVYRHRVGIRDSSDEASPSDPRLGQTQANVPRDGRR